jgi:hypothetical protein
MMSLVVQQPNSNTNDSDKFRVVDFEGWIQFVNGAATSYAFTAHDTWEQAQAAADAGNRAGGLIVSRVPDSRIVRLDPGSRS